MWLGISASCDHCTPTVADSASVVSFLPDGTDVRVEATGIRAAVGLEFYPGTSDLFVTMNQRDDLGARTPGDWLAIVASGQAWGFPDCYGQGGTACAGVPSPVAVLDAHAAVSGVAIVTGQLGGAIGTSAIVAEWSLGKVQQVALATMRRGWQNDVHGHGPAIPDRDREPGGGRPRSGRRALHRRLDVRRRLSDRGRTDLSGGEGGI